MVSRSVLRWLTQEEEPAMRYLALRDLEGRPESDSEVREARRAIPIRGWVAEILADRQPGGWWVDPKRLYVPKYISTNWKLLVLSDLGLDRSHPAIAESCALWIRRFRTRDGGFSGSGGAHGHLCLVGNTARALIRFGYEDHPAVKSALDWLVGAASPLGGWSCWGSGRNLDSWEGLSAFAAYPRSRWTAAMKDRVEKGAEFFLERELHRQGPRYAPWFRFHYPVHYYYDLLVGLDLLTSLGYRDDRRLRFALGALRRKRRSDGRWLLDAVHPDVEGPPAEWYRRHPRQAPIPFALETAGRPSKMITFLAERVLCRLDGTA